PDAGALADELLALTSTPRLREHIRRSALERLRGRTWKAALEQLAAGYGTVLEKRANELGSRVA
ncbi:MAG: hypothetical protein WBP81_13455, partial [Solirubrobacteraceae bacterium]